MRFYPVGAFAAKPVPHGPALPQPGPVVPEPPKPQPLGQLPPRFLAPPMPGYPLQPMPPVWAVQNAQFRAAETLMRLRWMALRQRGPWGPAAQLLDFPRWLPF